MRNHLLLALLVVVVDQASKLLILDWLPPGGVVAQTAFFNWVLTFNAGAAFSFLRDAGGWQKWFFIALALAVSAWLVVMLRQHRDDTAYARGLALILGGALGNVIDRFRFDAVVDFLDFHWGGAHFPAFNAADSAITLGVLVILLLQLRKRP